MTTETDWNVEGIVFPQYHAFLDDFYNSVWEQTDSIAEHIRTLDSYAPGSFSRYSELARIKDEVNIPSAMSMMTKLEADNRIVIESLSNTFKIGLGRNIFYSLCYIFNCYHFNQIFVSFYFCNIIVRYIFINSFFNQFF